MKIINTARLTWLDIYRGWRIMYLAYS